MIFFLGAAFGGAFGDVGAGAFAAGHADQSDAPEGVVGGAVSASVRAVALVEPGGGVDGTDAAERGEGGFALRPKWAEVTGNGLADLVPRESGRRLPEGSTWACARSDDPS